MSAVQFTQHAHHTWFRVDNGQLMIGGLSIGDLTVQAGRTPFYAYDRSVITRKIEALRHLLPDAVHLHYAMKANSNPDVVRHCVGLTDGVDVASSGELRIAVEAGARPENISFAGPGKTDAELEFAVSTGVTINAESERELGVLAALADRLGRRPRVAIRVNPDFELKSSGMKMGGGPKPFGIDAERVPEVLREVGRLPLEFRGFHIFWGSQNLSPAAIIDAQTKTVELGVRLAAYAPSPIALFNIGGGFGIPYFPGEQLLDIAPIAANLHSLVSVAQAAMPSAELILELGRYLVGESGVYVCRVIDRKISRGQIFLITDGGLHHHLAASGNFGQVIRKNYPVIIGNRASEPATERVSVVGPLCTPLDLLADRMELARAEIGDLVVILQSGAYGYSASPHGFLCHPPPIEVVV